MRFLTRSEVRPYFEGRTVAVVGSGPGVEDNEPWQVDSHQVVVRVNNYKLSDAAGRRCDVHYSFYGGSVRKTADELLRDGVRLCYCKCPDAKFIDSPWHESRGKQNGVDFRYIYRARRGWWPCDTFVPSVSEFVSQFELLGRRIPTTGFAAILEVLSHGPRSVYLTGFDFFASGLHNVDERWRPGDPTDPIGHDPRVEREWLRGYAGPVSVGVDPALAEVLQHG